MGGGDILGASIWRREAGGARAWAWGWSRYVRTKRERGMLSDALSPSGVYDSRVSGEQRVHKQAHVITYAWKGS